MKNLDFTNKLAISCMYISSLLTAIELMILSNNKTDMEENLLTLVYIANDQTEHMKESIENYELQVSKLKRS